jgi:hypothetical protein
MGPSFLAEMRVAGDYSWLRNRYAQAVVSAVLVYLCWQNFAAPARLSGGIRSKGGPALVTPLPLHTVLTEGLHVTPYDQRLAAALRLQVRDGLQCQEASSAGTLGWSTAQWQEAVGAAAAYRARRSDTLAALTATSIDRPSLWFDQMPAMVACGGRDPDARPHRAALMRYGGEADGGKWLCSMAELKAPCIVYSLGSWGVFDFEEAIASSTPCETFTFDCTVPPERMPKSLPPHTQFEPVCIGKDNADGSFQSLTTVAKRLGHTKVHLLKMDIEGYEFGVLQAMRSSYDADPAGSYSFLPLQISVELHLHTQTVDNAARALILYSAFQNLLDMGYVAVSREFNLKCPHCEEFVFIRLARECFAA